MHGLRQFIHGSGGKRRQALAFAALFTSIALMLPAAVAAASLVRNYSYESGTALAEGHTATSYGLTTTTAVARNGTQAGQALVRQGDPQWKAGGYRSEWNTKDVAGEGAERWYGLSYYFPSDYNQGTNSNTWNDRILFQFWDSGPPHFSLHLDASRQQLFIRQKRSNGSYAYSNRLPFVPGVWYDIVVDARWSKGSGGRFNVTVNGQPWFTYSGRTLAVNSTTYFKYGTYGQPTKVIIDDVRIANGGDGLPLVDR